MLTKRDRRVMNVDDTVVSVSRRAGTHAGPASPRRVVADGIGAEVIA